MPHDTDTTRHNTPLSREKALLITRMLDLTDDELREVLRRAREEGIL